jgi:hypothetical protein
MSKKDLTWFVRFGGLNAKTQKGFGDDGYNAPPASRGFYAMPLVAQEFKLIRDIWDTQPEQWPRNSDDLPVEKQGRFYRQMRKEFRKTDGFIWHHLEEYVDQCEVVARHHSWVKTSLKAWQTAFGRCALNDRHYNRPYKLHFEVFIDEKV